MTAGPPEDEGLPESIGPYRIRRRIGQGGMGVVYQGVNSRDELVAIKVLRPEVAGDDIARARLAREVETMRRVHSRNVAEVIDADTSARQPWVVTEYIPGPTLDDTVTKYGPLRGRALTRMVSGLAQALKDIHAAEVIHRDLKPGNVIISNGEPIVIDFGIAHAVDSAKLTQTGTFVGTPSYLSPEVIEGTDLSPATDIHAWGATVSFAATGNPPYGAGAFEIIFFRILNGEIDLSGMPDALQPLVQRAVSRDLTQRPTAAQLIEETGRLNLDLPWAGGEAAAAGFTGSHTVHASMPEASEPSASSASVAADPRSTGVGEFGGGAMAPAEAAGEPATREAPEEQTAEKAADEEGAGPHTAFFNSTLRPEEFADILPPVEKNRRRAQPAQPSQTAMFEADQAHDNDGQPQPYYDPDFDKHGPRRLPWLILIPLLLIVVGLAQMLPTLGLAIGLLSVSVLGALDMIRAEHSRRLMERGPRSSDGWVVAFSFPWALLRTSGKVLAYGGAYLIAGILVGMIIGLTPIGEFSPTYVGAYAVSLVVLLSYVGPNASGARRQANTLIQNIGIENPYVYWGSIVAVCLAALFSVVFGLQVIPDWRPIPDPSGWFG